MFELLLLLPFAAAGVAGVKVFFDYVSMRGRGVEVPKALFSYQPTGEIRMHDWSQRQIESMDAKRQKAIAIGKAELAQTDPETWEELYHESLEGAGAKREHFKPGVIVQSYHPEEGYVEYENPATYSIVGCDCGKCQRVRDEAENTDGWAPRALKAIDNWRKGA